MKRLLLLLLLASPASASEFLTHPNLMLTPGVTRDLSLRTICRTKWGSDERAVTKAMKDNVAEKYMFDVATCPVTKIKGKRVRRYEIDHLVPRSIGGADEEANLWPQCYEPPMADKSQQADGANKKDRLEKFLNKDVCKKRSPELLAEYQQKIRTDWRGLYQEIYGDE